MNKRAAAIIIKDEQILLIRRVVEGRGEYWVFPGGGVEAGETEEQAMVREVQEELSLTVRESKLLFEVFNEFTMGKFPPRQEYYYLVTDFTGKVALGGEEAKRMNEHDQYHPTWVSLKDIPIMKNLVPEVARVRLINQEYGK